MIQSRRHLLQGAVASASLLAFGSSALAKPKKAAHAAKTTHAAKAAHSAKPSHGSFADWVEAFRKRAQARGEARLHEQPELAGGAADAGGELRVVPVLGRGEDRGGVCGIETPHERLELQGEILGRSTGGRDASIDGSRDQPMKPAISTTNTAGPSPASMKP